LIVSPSFEVFVIGGASLDVRVPGSSRRHCRAPLKGLTYGR